MKETLESLEDEFTKLRLLMKKFMWMDPGIHMIWLVLSSCNHFKSVGLLAKAYAERKTAKR